MRYVTILYRSKSVEKFKRVNKLFCDMHIPNPLKIFAPRNTFTKVATELVDLLELPAGLEKLGFRHISAASDELVNKILGWEYTVQELLELTPEPVIKRDLNSGIYLRDADGSLPQMLLLYFKSEGLYRVDLRSLVNEERYQYAPDSQVTRAEILPLISDYLQRT